MRFRFRLKRFILSVLGLVTGLWMAGDTWISFQEEQSLASGGMRTMAFAREWRVYQGRGGRSYQLRYDFKVAGRAEDFTRRALFPYERKDLWESLPEPDWEQTRRTGRIEVIYLPNDPWTNRPAQTAGERRNDRMIGMVAGVGFAIAGLVSLAVGFSQYRQFRSSPDGRRQFWLFWVEGHDRVGSAMDAYRSAGPSFTA